MNFDEAFEKLLGHEGKFVDHPSDPGGATMWGITHDTARRNGYLGDMEVMPVDTAKKIAKRCYWDAVSADALPDAVRFDVFDGAYNSGPRQSIKWLQRSIWADDDGVIGPRTLMAASTYNPAAIVARYNGHRQMMMTDLSTWTTFGKGWARRLAGNLLATKG